MKVLKQEEEKKETLTDLEKQQLVEYQNLDELKQEEVNIAN